MFALRKKLLELVVCGWELMLLHEARLQVSGLGLEVAYSV